MKKSVLVACAIAAIYPFDGVTAGSKPTEGPTTIKPAPLVSIASHDAFFENLKQHCGNAYKGKVKVDNQDNGAFSGKKLVMHVRKCSDTE